MHSLVRPRRYLYHSYSKLGELGCTIYYIFWMISANSGIKVGENGPLELNINIAMIGTNGELDWVTCLQYVLPALA